MQRVIGRMVFAAVIVTLCVILIAHTWGDGQLAIGILSIILVFVIGFG